MEQNNPFNNIAFFEAYKNGQRYFTGLDLDYLEGFSNKDFSYCVFESCFLNVDFRYSNLKNVKFISCNIKTIDLRHTNLTDGLITNCSVECAMFSGAIINGFQFMENYAYGATLWQEDFDSEIYNTNAYILTKELSEMEFNETMCTGMNEVTKLDELIFDIWPFVKDLVYENIVSEHVFNNKLLEKVYRNNTSTFNHILLPTNNESVYIVIIVNLIKKNVFGYFKLDLMNEYSSD